MDILADVIGREFAAWPARGDDRDFLGERDAGFEDRRRAAERAKRHGEIGAFANQDLALPVIAEPARLEDRWASDLGDRAGERAGIVYPHVRCRLDSRRRQKLLLGEAILANCQRLGAWPHNA